VDPAPNARITTGRGTKRSRPTKVKTHLDKLRKRAEELGIPLVDLSKEDIEELEHIDVLTQTQNQIERLVSIEAQTVDTEKWNKDAVEQLLSIALAQKGIPFGKREELFDLRPTADDPAPMDNEDDKQEPGPSRKGKERAVDEPAKKRSIYNLLPADVRQSWLGEPGE
jgi:hypothetical protein